MTEILGHSKSKRKTRQTGKRNNTMKEREKTMELDTEVNIRQ